MTSSIKYFKKNGYTGLDRIKCIPKYLFVLNGDPIGTFLEFLQGNAIKQLCQLGACIMFHGTLKGDTDLSQGPPSIYRLSVP